MTDTERRINRAATIAAIVILSTALVAAGVGLIALWHDVQANRAQIADLRAQVVELGGIPGQTVIVNPAPAAPSPTTSSTVTAPPPATSSSTTPTPPTSTSKISSAPPTSTPPATSPPTSAPSSTTTTSPPTTSPLVCIVRPPVTVC